MPSLPSALAAPALIDGLHHWPAKTVAHWVAATAARLAAVGIAPGDRVGLLTTNSPAALVGLLALLQRGAVACPLSTRDPQALTTLKLRLVGARQLLVSCVSPPAPAAWPCRVFVLEDLVGEWPGAERDNRDGRDCRDEEPARNNQLPMPSHSHYSHLAAPQRDAVIIFTSGSGGVPKAVLHRHASLTCNALGANANLPLLPDDRWLLSLPLFHVGGLGILWRCALAGATVVLPPPAGADLAALLAAQRITHVSLVPTQLLRLLAEPDSRWAGSLTALLLGGGPIPASLADAAAARGLPLLTSYGLTEMGSQVTATAPGDTPACWHTAGRLLAHRQLRLAPDGEILVAGETLAAGVCTPGGGLQPLAATDGWYRTGDRGEWDADGRLRVLGRLDAMFISGGENIHPELIEAALLSLEGVRQALVVPVADAVFGQRPVAFLEASVALTLTEVCAALASHLPRFMAPIALHPWPTFATGLKPDRAAFTRLAAELAAR